MAIPLPRRDNQIYLQRGLIILLACLLVYSLFGQQTVEPLLDFNLTRIDHQKKAMFVLGGWAITNIAAGAILSNQRSGSDKYFHQMNAYWNVVNLGIAGLGYLSAAREQAELLGVYASSDAHFGFQRVLLLNAGLDIGYILGGLYLTERSRRFVLEDPDKEARLKGFGQSIMLQGGFLFLFDVANHFISAGRNSELKLILSEGGQLGISLIF
jgi:hypothetical protein